MQLSSLGDAAVLIRFDGSPEHTRTAVARCIQALHTRPPAGVTDVVPSFATVAVFYDPVRVAHERGGSASRVIQAWIEERISVASEAAVEGGREYVVPVAFGGAFGQDLGEVSRRTGFSPEEVVTRYCAASYEVRAVGFSPGFPYLGGLPSELSVPRRETPRTSVAAGSVGIGGHQTGIYGITTPGGWNLIGRTSWVLFDPSLAAPCLFRVGDRVRFTPVDEPRFHAAGKGPLWEINWASTSERKTP